MPAPVAACTQRIVEGRHTGITGKLPAVFERGEIFVSYDFGINKS
jgi:hypothetical protein